MTEPPTLIPGRVSRHESRDLLCILFKEDRASRPVRHDVAELARLPRLPVRPVLGCHVERGVDVPARFGRGGTRARIDVEASSRAYRWPGTASSYPRPFCVPEGPSRAYSDNVRSGSHARLGRI